MQMFRLRSTFRRASSVRGRALGYESGWPAFNLFAVVVSKGTLAPISFPRVQMLYGILGRGFTIVQSHLKLADH